ncbi:hypothetical protein [Alteribacter populi]|nr:hypothetical protein [Alteribacter populi]
MKFKAWGKSVARGIEDTVNPNEVKGERMSQLCPPWGENVRL